MVNLYSRLSISTEYYTHMLDLLFQIYIAASGTLSLMSFIVKTQQSPALSKWFKASFATFVLFMGAYVITINVDHWTEANHTAFSFELTAAFRGYRSSLPHAELAHGTARSLHYVDLWHTVLNRTYPVFDLLQTTLGCCGVSGRDDYLNVTLQVPYSCSNHTSGCRDNLMHIEGPWRMTLVIELLVWLVVYIGVRLGVWQLQQ